MNKRKIAVGPGASSLILIAVVLALSVLTVLTMISARSDEALAARSIETRQEVFGMFADAERSLARLDGVLISCLKEHPASQEEYLALVGSRLPEGMRLKENQVFWSEKAEDRTLACAVRILEIGSGKRTEWTNHSLGAGDIWEEEDFDDFGGGDEDEDAADGDSGWEDEEETESEEEDFGGEEETADDAEDAGTYEMTEGEEEEDNQ